MSEGDEESVPRNTYWNWVALAVVLLIGGALYLIPEQPFHAQGAGMSVKAKTDIAAILQSLDEYAIANEGSYPSTLDALVAPDGDGRCYLDGYNGLVPLDPWKRPYRYQAPTPDLPRPLVWTYGAGGKPGGTGDNADIDSEHLLEEAR
jgi:general secretion pathway protein G